jgi:predicted  nucleic acid-binding Zn-ribbon protein
MPVGQLCRWCRQPGHNVRTCASYAREIEAIDIKVEGDVRRAVELIRRMWQLKDDEIRELKNELRQAERANADLRRKLAAAQATIEAQDSVISAQFDVIEERDGLIRRLMAQLGSVFS